MTDTPELEPSKAIPPDIRMARYARVLAAVSGALGLMGLIGLVANIDVLERVKTEYFPTAPGSSWMILVLSALMILTLHPRRTRLTDGVRLLGIGFVLAFTAWATMAYFVHPSFDLEQNLFGRGPIEEGFAVHHMSPVASAGFLFIGSALVAQACEGRFRGMTQLSVLLSGGSAMIGLVGVLGYAYGSPLLYGSPTRPISLIATISLSILGVAAICMAGPTPWPTRAVVGQSVRARLLRVFPLITATTVLVICWLFRQTEGSGNPAIVASIIALASTVIVVLVVSKIADVIGWEVDRSNAELLAAKEKLKRLNEQLNARSSELSAVNKELEAFSYSVSHDLRAPLTHIDGYASILAMEYAAGLDEKGKEYVSRIRASTKRMNILIDDLLQLSRVTKSDMKAQEVDLSAIARTILARLKMEDPDRNVTVDVAANTPATGDPKLVEIALENLLNNSWKFTSKKAEARIEFGSREIGGRTVYFVKDDGAGFEPQHRDRLFVPFQRLHSVSEFSGTGIGLATVRRIIIRHGGEVWAEGEVGKGATFFFTLGESRPAPEDDRGQSETMSST